MVFGKNQTKKWLHFKEAIYFLFPPLYTPPPIFSNHIQHMFPTHPYVIVLLSKSNRRDRRRRKIILVSPNPRDLDIRSLQDFVVIRNDAFCASMAVVAVAVLAARVHGDDVVRTGTLVALTDTIGALRAGGNPAGHADEQGAERGKGAEDEDEPAFGRCPDDEGVYAV